MVEQVSEDPRHQIRFAKKRLLALTQFAIGVLFTSLACLFNELTVNAVQYIHPGYPREVILAAYMPPPTAEFLHRLGIHGLIVALLIFIANTIALWRFRRTVSYTSWSSRLEPMWHI